jgi:hypothetical protein
MAYFAPVDDSREYVRIWRRELSPSKLRRVVEQLLAEYLAEGELQEVAVWRQSAYGWLSLFVHGHRGAAFWGAYTLPSPKSDAVRHTLGGRYSMGSEATIHETIYFNWFFLQILYRLLFDKHGWRFDFKHRRGRWLYFRHQVLTELFLEHNKAYGEGRPLPPPPPSSIPRKRRPHSA